MRKLRDVLTLVTAAIDWATARGFGFSHVISIGDAALLAGAGGGLVRILAQAAVLILASLAGALAGFLLSLAPFVDRFIGSAPWAGILGTLGTIGGMSLAETLIARLDKRG